MKKLTILLRVIGVVQLILGAAYLFAPGAFTTSMKLAAAPHDTNYAFGMLAARFIAYGIGVFYTLNGTLALASSAFPMFDAVIFAGLLFLWRPKQVANLAK